MAMERTPGPAAKLALRPEANVGTVLDALDRIARVLPHGHELFTAVVDERRHASDVLVRHSAGQTSVLLGLAAVEHDQLVTLLHSLRESIERVSGGTPRDIATGGPAAEPQTRHDFRTIVEECPLPLLVISGAGMIEYASPATVAALGVDEPAQLQGLYFRDFLHPDDRERMARVAGLSLHSPQSTTMTVGLRRADGGSSRADLAVRLLPGEDRLILALHTPRVSRSGIEEVLAAEQRQRALAGAADAGIALVQTAAESLGALVDMNPSFGRLFGLAPGELVGAVLWTLFDAADAARVRLALEQVCADAGSRELEARLGGERRRRVRVRISPDRSSGEPPSLASVLLRDVTEEHGRMGELHRAVDRLARENRQLAEFARITAHDLMVPLRAVSGLVDLLAPGLEQSSHDTLAAIQSSLSRMLAMVDSAVGFAGAHQGRVRHGPTDLNRVVNHALETLQVDIIGTDASVTVHALPTVVGDPAQLERLFLSLLINAISYSGGIAPSIEIRARADGTMWRILVADQGIGVVPHARHTIFDLFKRHGDAPARAGAGRGIGLATCRQIVEGLGGRIWVEDNRPRGAVFAFTLPAG